LSNVNAILKLADGTIMLVCDKDGTLVSLEEELLAGKEKEPLVVRPRLVRDKTGRLWGYLADQPGKISRWDGKQWKHFDLPAGFLDNEGVQLGCDSLNRLWAFNSVATAPTLIIAEDDSIQSYNSYLDAALGQKDLEYEFLKSTLVGMTPVKNQDGKVALLSPDAFYLYDGQNWVTSGRSVMHRQLLNSFSAWNVAPCSFTAEGRPKLISPDASAEFVAPNEWKTLPKEKEAPLEHLAQHGKCIVDCAGNQFEPMGIGKKFAYRMSSPPVPAAEKPTVPSAAEAAAQAAPSPGQIQDWVKVLEDPDRDKRTAAVKALAACGTAALPALHEARKTADQNLLWWIDATIDEIERKSKR
jgi:hypothetical protein